MGLHEVPRFLLGEDHLQVTETTPRWSSVGWQVTVQNFNEISLRNQFLIEF